MSCGHPCQEPAPTLGRPELCMAPCDRTRGHLLALGHICSWHLSADRIDGQATPRESQAHPGASAASTEGQDTVAGPLSVEEAWDAYADARDALTECAATEARAWTAYRKARLAAGLD